MSQASEAATKLANDFGLNLETVEGTGKDGLITKADVERSIEEPAKTNIMDAAKKARLESRPEPSSLAEAESTGVILPSQQELLDIIKDMRGEIESMREAQAGLIERENQSRDLTDELFFIAKPNGHRWEERRVVDGKTVAVEFVATAFIGPFSEREDIDAYVAFKKTRREDAYIDWETFSVMSGREARQLDSQEAAERDGHFTSSAPVNVLDRRIFAQNHTGHTPGIGKIVGQAS